MVMIWPQIYGTTSFYQTCFTSVTLMGAQFKEQDYNLGLVYTMDHEIGPWKMVFFHDPTWWSNFHGLISYKISLQSLWVSH